MVYGLGLNRGMDLRLPVLSARRAGGFPRAGRAAAEDAALHELRAHRPRRRRRRAAPALRGAGRRLGTGEEEALGRSR